MSDMFYPQPGGPSTLRPTFKENREKILELLKIRRRHSLWLEEIAHDVGVSIATVKKYADQRENEFKSKARLMLSHVHAIYKEWARLKEDDARAVAQELPLDFFHELETVLHDFEHLTGRR